MYELKYPAVRIKEKILKNGYSLQAGENYIELVKHEMHGYDFKSFCINEKINKKVLAELKKSLYRFTEKEKCIIQSEDSERDRKQTRFLHDCGFVIKFSKQCFHKNLSRHFFEYNDIFEYRSIDETGVDLFFETFKASADKTIRTADGFKRYIEKIKREYGNKNGISGWKLVSLNSRPIGIVMPFKIFSFMPPLYNILKEAGTLLNIAVIPEERGKGYGRIIHSRGLMILKEMGLRIYMGSTESDNCAMLRVFKINKCRKSLTQYFFYTKH